MWDMEALSHATARVRSTKGVIMKRPWQQLPIPHPRDHDPGPAFFYENIVQPLISDFIRLMANGLRIDNNKVEELRSILDANLATVASTLADNPIIKQYQEQQYKKNRTNLIAEQKSKFRTLDYYLKPYKPSDIIHRTYLVNTILDINNLSADKRSKWSIRDVKRYSDINPIQELKAIINKTTDPTDTLVQQAMTQLATDKLTIYNKSKMLKVEQATHSDLAPPFNPGSSVQKHELLTDLLGYESGKESKAHLDYHKQLSYGKTPSDKNGKPKREPNRWSWGRDQLENLLRITPEDESNLKKLLQSLVDYSFNAIIRTNFIEAFDSFTIDGILHGNIKLLGAVSGRNTSNAP